MTQVSFRDDVGEFMAEKSKKLSKIFRKVVSPGNKGYDSLSNPSAGENFRQEIEQMFEGENFSQYLGAVKGVMWAVLISIYLWLITGIIVVLLLLD